MPVACAKCHGAPGHLDYLGADGSATGVVDALRRSVPLSNAWPVADDVNLTKTSVVMPSGLELTGLGDESRCVQCHQGRKSKVSVDTFIREAEIRTRHGREELGFRNIHYYAAAVTKYGTLAKGGYEYDRKGSDANSPMWTNLTPVSNAIIRIRWKSRSKPALTVMKASLRSKTSARSAWPAPKSTMAR